MGQYDDRPYEVGKGKPPRAHQFQPGVSGNPKGPRHKKKAKDATLGVLLHEAVNQLVSVVINGREVRLPKKQAIIMSIVNDGLTGTPAQRLKAFKVLSESGAFEPSIEDNRLTPEMQQEALQNLVGVLIAEGKRDEASRHLFEEYQ